MDISITLHRLNNNNFFNCIIVFKKIKATKKKTNVSTLQCLRVGVCHSVALMIAPQWGPNLLRPESERVETSLANSKLYTRAHASSSRRCGTVCSVLYAGRAFNFFAILYIFLFTLFLIKRNYFCPFNLNCAIAFIFYILLFSLKCCYWFYCELFCA